MKRIVLFLSGVFLCSPMMAQTFQEGINTTPVKLKDVIENYKKNLQPYAIEKEDENENNNNNIIPIPEGADYHFDRWLWYWKQHLDQDGNMVSPIKNWEESKLFFSNNTPIGPLAKTTNTNAQWVFEGPDSSGANGAGVGRLNVIAFHPTDTNTYWVGSPGGGAWKTTNNGLTWTCMTDQLPLIAVSDIVFNPLNPNVIYLATGDRDGGDYYSVGVLRSNDGGQTWNETGLNWQTSQLRQTNSLIINPQDTGSLTLATSVGMYKSFNGGATWFSTYTGNFKQVLYHPTDTNIIYASTYFSQSIVTTTSAQIFRSADGGLTWTQVTGFGSALRIAMAVTPASANVVVAIASSASSGTMNSLNGIFTSTDTGNTFTTTYTDSCLATNVRPNLLGNNTSGSDCTYGQGFYDLCIALNPTNASDIYIGGINTWYSTNGGSSWSILNHGYGGGTKVHPDKHYLKFHPLIPTRIYECNDGGLYWTNNPTGTSTWTNATNGLGITEVYRVAVSNIATYQVLGAQDVGSKMIRPSFPNSRDVLGGDGMECNMDYADSTVYYAESEYGSIERLNIAGGGANISVSGQTGGWITPYIIEPSNHTHLLSGYQAVWESANQGGNWTQISPTLTNGGDLLRVVATPQTSTTIYALDDGSPTMFYTHNHGANWTTKSTNYSAIPSDILIDPRDSNHIWITFSGYNSPAIAEYDATSNVWTEIKYNLPNVPVNCLVLDTSNWNLYVGTDIGVFYLDPTMTTWQAYTTGMPSVRVNDLQINYTTSEIWAATYGRSIWKSPKQVNTLGVSIVPFTLNSLNIYPNPSYGTFTVTAPGLLSGQNVEIHLVDMAGKEIFSGSYAVSANGRVQVNTNNIPRGSYILEVATSELILGRNKIVIY